MSDKFPFTEDARRAISSNTHFISELEKRADASERHITSLDIDMTNALIVIAELKKRVERLEMSL